MQGRQGSQSLQPVAAVTHPHCWASALCMSMHNPNPPVWSVLQGSLCNARAPSNSNRAAFPEEVAALNSVSAFLLQYTFYTLNMYEDNEQCPGEFTERIIHSFFGVPSFIPPGIYWHSKPSIYTKIKVHSQQKQMLTTPL